MTAVSVGSISFIPSQGRLGVVVGAQEVGAPVDGCQAVAVKVKTIGASPCQESAKTDPAARTDPLDPRAIDPRAVEPGARAGEAPQGRASRPGELGSAASGPRPGARSYEQLEPEEKAVVDRLRQRDAQVKQEEKAHAAAAGDLAGPISYVYQLGPDGRLYAVGGSVPLQAQTISGDPSEAARIGARIAAAGQAATNPSGADLAAVRNGYRLQGLAGQGPRPAGAGLDITA